MPTTVRDPGFPRLLGDVGGTNARWAWQAAPGELTHLRTLPVAGYASITDCIASYLRTEGLAAPRLAAFGIATAIGGDRVQMTNHPWAFSIAELQLALGVQRLLVLNDFEALAHAVPVLDARDLRPVGNGTAVPQANLAVIGPGTGLGVSGLVWDGARWRVIVGEGGHVTLPAATAREASLLAVLRERFSHVSAERALSGPGLVNLYQALCALDGLAAETLDAAQIVQRALEAPTTPSHAACAEVLQTFAAMLGTVAGNLALTLGARGGVFIGGGIVPRLGTRFDRLPFRERFVDKGRFCAYLEAIPTWVINADSPALRGAARALDAEAP